MKNPDKLVLRYIGLSVAALSLMCWAIQAQTSNKSNKKMLEELIRNVDVRVEDLSLPSQTQSPQDIRVRWQGEASTSPTGARSEEHTSELQSLRHLVCRLLLEKKKNKQ